MAPLNSHTGRHRSGEYEAVWNEPHVLGPVTERRLRADDDPEMDAAFERAMADDPTARWAVQQGMYVLGASTPRAFAAAYLDYHLRDDVAERIACPTLVCAGTEDDFFQGRPELLYEHLTCEKTLLRFTAEEGAGAHCRAGAQRPAHTRVFDWLDEVIAPRGYHDQPLHLV